MNPNQNNEAARRVGPPRYTNQVQQRLNEMWAKQSKEIEEMTDFKNHSLPLNKIKKIMKLDEDVRKISSEAPAVFAKACEMFIQDLTTRAWANAEDNYRRTLKKVDIEATFSTTISESFKRADRGSEALIVLIENTMDILPLGRTKRIMKSDKDEKIKVTIETPSILAKACEMFIKDLTARAWANAEDNNRTTIATEDVASAISNNHEFDFLADVLPIDEHLPTTPAAPAEKAPGNPNNSPNAGQCKKQ
ncbi:hypothetical protein Fmac_031830 [Flemingia macrophylla]|uniref:Transcription factor CBF/NF-Y/archaeal histone domain-containing protein n=1 Tax=Flemingia macrophylla TaxID=520843 RepID=A0ABD1L362_9FABA